MIGRFSRSLGWKPHAPIVAGVILLVLGVWQGGDPVFAVYPGDGDLKPVTGTGGDVIELNVQSAGLPMFSGGPVLECRAILQPGDRPVLYRSNLPDYDVVQQALEGEVTVLMWETAPDAFNRTLIWGISAGGAPIVSTTAIVGRLPGLARRSHHARRHPGRRRSIACGFWYLPMVENTPGRAKLERIAILRNRRAFSYDRVSPL